MILNLSSFTIKYGGMGFSLWDIEELAVMKILRESATCLYDQVSNTSRLLLYYLVKDIKGLALLKLEVKILL